MVLKAVVLVSWFGLALLGLFAWSRRNWLVVGVPIVSYATLWAIISIGTHLVGWFLTWGY